MSWTLMVYLCSRLWYEQYIQPQSVIHHILTQHPACHDYCFRSIELIIFASSTLLSLTHSFLFSLPVFASLFSTNPKFWKPYQIASSHLVSFTTMTISFTFYSTSLTYQSWWRIPRPQWILPCLMYSTQLIWPSKEDR